ncbi:ChbG/HpnK family deacetylase [Sphingomonas flavescens]|uniref:ChbG/HpnK family deacetylase n=1 Tax=Sphingomonas flavescens TaxID=3132797 RepID=UPI002804528B|nr:ChbG/HpnK family deacetylase [Sphingomonas limnosediminicola]
MCADDFAMSAGISRTIVELAQSGKLNAISCMAASRRWPADAALLKDLPGDVEIGLHLVLTDEAPCVDTPELVEGDQLPSAGRLGGMAFLRRLPIGAIGSEVNAQFERFEEVMGRPPDFVDGHQHVHFLPGIRRVVIEATSRRAPRAWLRTCEDKLWRILRRPFRVKSLVNALQAAGFARAARRAGLRCNDSFAGFYDFRSPFQLLLPRFFTARGQFHLVICHPGDTELADDPISVARLKEAEALRKWISF